jgi:Zn-dependent protease with chaperone function
MVTRGLLESQHLTAVLAHELGHLNTSDARLAAALVRMTTPPRGAVHRPFRTIAFIASGAVATWLMRLPWAVYWRGREYAADEFAANLGQAQPLTLFLDEEILARDIPAPFPWMATSEDLPQELRIGRIEYLRARQ